MLHLPNVTLIALTNRDFEGHKRALDRSCEGIEWGGVKIIWDDKITGIGNWNEKVIKDLYKYIDTSHALLIHSDGYVIGPDCWDDSWLELDYIGSPWPLPADDFSYRDESGEIQRVGNSVSLRSKKLMQLAATRPVEYRYGNNNEDGHICCWNRKWLESQGCKFATFEQALKFGKEAPLPENEGLSTFVFHEYQ
jgi:hypothetical protein